MRLRDANLHNQCLEVIKNASDIPSEIKQYCVHEEKDGKSIYLDAYIPFIGNRYGQAAKALFYCTAQNLSDRNAIVRKEYADNPELAIKRLCLKKPGTLHIDVGPISGGVLPALAGLVLYLENNLFEEDLTNVLEYIAVTNFYKFSLWNTERKDLNPDRLEESLRDRYDRFMLENYIKHEIEILKPDYIFIFGKTRHMLLKKYLEEKNPLIKLFRINDTAWLLRGGGWKKEPSVLDNKVNMLIESYCRYIRTRSEMKDPHFYAAYGKRVKQIESYLRHYYFEIVRNFQ
ncbi:MAG: hypothetical protein KJ706_08140 [Candidatus Omnitrophica bacterium]|nr:hypothetical protein [Candidatus Omnitrophota bacterium]